MEVLYYPLIYHEFNALTPKQECIAMFVPIDVALINKWHSYITIPEDPNQYIRDMIDFIYTSPQYNEQLLMQHNNIALNLALN